MKQAYLIIAGLLFTHLVEAQLRLDSTSVFTNEISRVLGRDTYLENGKICIANGYQAVYSADKKIVVIKRVDNRLGPIGGGWRAFTCRCLTMDEKKSKECDCSITVSGESSLFCVSGNKDSSGCKLWVGNVNYSLPPPHIIKWKRLILPSTQN